MNKKIIIILASILIIFVVYFGIYFYQNIQITKSLEEFNKKKLDNEHALVRCNWNIFEPEFAYVYFDSNISFDRQNKIFWDSKDWKKTYIGGTDVQNTTFENLLKMVKEDCYQFQKSKGYKVGNEKTEIYWTYGKYKAPKPKTKEEIEEDIKYKKEQEELLKKVESGEIIPKSTYDTLRESGLSDEAAKDVIKQMKEAGMKIYE